MLPAHRGFQGGSAPELVLSETEGAGDWVHRTADDAGAMIEKALEEAEDKVLAAAEQAASALPGGGDVEFFDPKSLKGKLGGKP